MVIRTKRTVVKVTAVKTPTAGGRVKPGDAQSEDPIEGIPPPVSPYRDFGVRKEAPARVIKKTTTR